MVPPHYSSCQWEISTSNFSSEFLKSSVVVKNPWFFWHPSRNTKKTEIDLRFCQSIIFSFPSTIPSYQYPCFFFPSFEKRPPSYCFWIFPMTSAVARWACALLVTVFYNGWEATGAYLPAYIFLAHLLVVITGNPKKWWERNNLKFIRRIHFRNERCIDGVFEFGDRIVTRMCCCRTCPESSGFTGFPFF